MGEINKTTDEPKLIHRREIHYHRNKTKTKEEKEEENATLKTKK